MLGLRLIHRYLLKELVVNAIASLVVVFAIFFLAALSIQVGKPQYENLPMVAVVRYVAFILLYTAYLTIPLAIVTTCIFTYGRAAQDGEISAALTSGIRMNHVLSPAVFLGACTMLLLAVIQDRVMPEAHWQSRQVDESVFMNVEQILKRRDKSIQLRSFVFTWNTVGQDASGNLVLEDVELVQYRDQKTVSWTRAKRARPVADADAPRVVLELEDVHRTQEGSSFRASRIDAPVDLSALIAPRRRSGENQLTYEELLSGAASASSTRRGNRLSAEFHFRVAMAISPLLLAAFAAPFGITFRVRNRAVVFLAGVLIMTLGYLPLVTLGKSVAERGLAPAWICTQVPNAILLVVAIWFVRKAHRP